MPAWGLTKEMRAAEPWGLDPELLRTRKVITDPVEGDIFVTELERQVIDSPPFQRLRRVRQLGSTHLVYPAATHNRFSHSLGSLTVAQRLMDAVLDQQLGPHPHDRDLFAEWRAELGSDEEGLREYWRRVGEATVLARLGALLHDFTHVPFGHSLEDDLRLLEAHDKNEERFERLWEQFSPTIREHLESEGLSDFLRPLIVSNRRESSDDDDAPKEIPPFAIPDERARKIPRCDERRQWYDFVRDIIGNTICADLLDYLHRDHLFTGLPFAVGSRYLASFYVTPIRDEVHYPARMVLRIHRGGQERPDVVTELLKHLRYRYELSERALVHHTKLSADAMIGKALEMWSDAVWRDLALDDVGRESPLADETDIGRLRERYARERDRATTDGITAKMQGAMEDELSRRGDDSFLEWLRDWAGDDANNDKRKAAIRTLADAILNRQLYKRIGVQTDVPIPPKDFYDRYGVKDRRRPIEEEAADFAEVDHSWKVLTWIPAHTMRLKVAGVLVDDASEVRRFVDHERGGDERGADIYRSHQNLWAVQVFVHESVTREQREVILARLAARMGVRFGSLEKKLGLQPAEWPERLAALRVCEARRSSSPENVESLFRYVREQRAARGETPGRFGLLMNEFEHAADAHFGH